MEELLLKYPLAFLIAFHVITDTFLQTREMGRNKSSNYLYLFAHCVIIFLGIGLMSFFIFDDFEKAALFALYNALIHGVIDLSTWNLYKISAWIRIALKHPLTWDSFMDYITGNESEFMDLAKRWAFWEDPWFYHTIVTDQAIHIGTLYVLLEIFTKA